MPALTILPHNVDSQDYLDERTVPTLADLQSQLNCREIILQ
jgi:hypothetical protein